MAAKLSQHIATELLFLFLCTPHSNAFELQTVKPVINSQKQIGILTKRISLCSTEYVFEKVPLKFTFFIFNYCVLMSYSVIQNDSTR